VIIELFGGGNQTVITVKLNQDQINTLNSSRVGSNLSINDIPSNVMF
jgi:hypothetical protein